VVFLFFFLSSLLLFLLSEQYVSLLFAHTGLPTNLMTQLNDIHKKSAQKNSAALQNHDYNMPLFSNTTNLLIVLLKNSSLKRETTWFLNHTLLQIGPFLPPILKALDDKHLLLLDAST